MYQWGIYCLLSARDARHSCESIGKTLCLSRTCSTVTSRSACGSSLSVPTTMMANWERGSRPLTVSDTCSPGWALLLLQSRDTWENPANGHTRCCGSQDKLIQREKKTTATTTWKYIAVLVDGHVRRITDDFTIGQNGVDGHTGLGGPGKCWRERKSGGSLGPCSQHLTFGAHLDKTDKSPSLILTSSRYRSHQNSFEVFSSRWYLKRTQCKSKIMKDSDCSLSTCKRVGWKLELCGWFTYNVHRKYAIYVNIQKHLDTSATSFVVMHCTSNAQLLVNTNS